jgi:hypothetical protein
MKSKKLKEIGVYEQFSSWDSHYYAFRNWSENQGCDNWSVERHPIPSISVVHVYSQTSPNPSLKYVLSLHWWHKEY